MSSLKNSHYSQAVHCPTKTYSLSTNGYIRSLSGDRYDLVWESMSIAVRRLMLCYSTPMGIIL